MSVDGVWWVLPSADAVSGSGAASEMVMMARSESGFGKYICTGMSGLLAIENERRIVLSMHLTRTTFQVIWRNGIAIQTLMFLAFRAERK